MTLQIRRASFCIGKFDWVICPWFMCIVWVGDSMAPVSYLFRMSQSMIRIMISNTICAAWTCQSGCRRFSFCGRRFWPQSWIFLLRTYCKCSTETARTTKKMQVTREQQKNPQVTRKPSFHALPCRPCFWQPVQQFCFSRPSTTLTLVCWAIWGATTDDDLGQGIPKCCEIRKGWKKT